MTFESEQSFGPENSDKLRQEVIEGLRQGNEEKFELWLRQKRSELNGLDEASWGASFNTMELKNMADEAAVLQEAGLSDRARDKWMDVRLTIEKYPADAQIDREEMDKINAMASQFIAQSAEREK